MLGVAEEMDYFGLTFFGAKHEILWINMRNKLVKQIPGTFPYRLHFRVKFFVQPHMLLQNETRRVFYLDVCRHVCSGNWHYGMDEEMRARLVAEMCQAEFGDYDSQTTACKYKKYFMAAATSPPPVVAPEDGVSTVATTPSSSAIESASGNACKDIAAEMLAVIAAHHRTLSGMSQSEAQQRLMQTAAQLTMYGVLFHDTKDCFEHKVTIGVGPTAIIMCDGQRALTERYAYPRVQKVTIADRIFYLSLSLEDGTVRELGYRLPSQRAANGLYRCVTETHSFFRCDTVRNDVTAQTSRDLKGTLVGLFSDHDTSLGRDYVFDIRRTGREVYDDARRKLFVCSAAAEQAPPSATPTSQLPAPRSPESGADRTLLELEALRVRLFKCEEQRLCRVCMDQDIARVFLPCGHMLCCGDCASRLESCPMCRVAVEAAQPVFVPWSC